MDASDYILALLHLTPNLTTEQLLHWRPISTVPRDNTLVKVLLVCGSVLEAKFDASSRISPDVLAWCRVLETKVKT